MSKKSGFVYFVENAGIVKIGRTNNWERRLRQFKTTMPFMRVLTIIPTCDMCGLEAYYHKFFKSRHVRGEWYRL
jgi:hypothetical protein